MPRRARWAYQVARSPRSQVFCIGDRRKPGWYSLLSWYCALQLFLVLGRVLPQMLRYFISICRFIGIMMAPLVGGDRRRRRAPNAATGSSQVQWFRPGSSQTSRRLPPCRQYMAVSHCRPRVQVRSRGRWYSVGRRQHGSEGRNVAEAGYTRCWRCFAIREGRCRVVG